MYLVNDPLFLGIISGTIAAVLGSLLVFYVLQYRRKRTTKTDLMNRLNRLDKSLKSDKINDVLVEYEQMLGTVSEAEHPEIYAHIMNNRGVCYGKLARIVDKEENLKKAVRAYEEALKIYTVEKYTLYYEAVVSNMSRVKQRMKAEDQ